MAIIPQGKTFSRYNIFNIIEYQSWVIKPNYKRRNILIQVSSNCVFKYFFLKFFLGIPPTVCSCANSPAMCFIIMVTVFSPSHALISLFLFMHS